MNALGYDTQEATTNQLVEFRRSFGFIFQQHNLLGFLTARQNVELMF